MDDLAAATGMPVAAVLESLLQLELDGRVAREPDGAIGEAACRHSARYGA